MEIQKDQKVMNKMAFMNKFLHINNYSKCTWVEFTNQKAQRGWMEKKKRSNYMLPTRDPFQI